MSMRAKKKTTTARKTTTASRRPRLLSDRQIGERTVQMLKMSDALYWSVILFSKNRSSNGKTVYVGNIYDESLIWFFERIAKTGYEAYLAVPMRSAQKRSLWVDSRLLERSGEIAERDGVPRNRVLYTALVLFLKEFGPIASKDDIARLKEMKSKAGGRGRPISSRQQRKTA